MYQPCVDDECKYNKCKILEVYSNLTNCCAYVASLLCEILILELAPLFRVGECSGCAQKNKKSNSLTQGFLNVLHLFKFLIYLKN